ncbi:NAD(P)/FAD-dependent oxidoreductase [Chitinophaga agrisoli]|uniref:NADH:ubiquinone reductase (non-electrogenic) n=1 Tax=Chitinophaga agrisoli TaxID=2607653 RepID=A0A5B2W0I0_9BACT|nr:NAD(P)/FAD-dependent oxidoreductase [Chitinophaga agrisoli]KAA2244438.1 NAD(P)/FAD-dependent oxidoreductase [Chitinophaga agrisoli]
MTQHNSKSAKKQVLIAGGGFAGLNLAKHLYKSKDYDVTLLDKNNYNYFTPLLYQVATGFLDPSSISYPFRKLFRKKGIQYRMAALEKVDPATHTAVLSDGEMKYDYLVFAAGAKTNFFGNENIERNAIALKGVDDAIKMRNALLNTMEKAAKTTDLSERQRLLTIVVAGGGPTGVEVVGMLAEMRRHIMLKDYPELAGAKGGIYIVDGAEHLLTAMSGKTQEETYQALEALGVTVLLNTRVTDFANDVVKLSSGVIINAKTLIWSAGITAHTFEGIPESSLGIGKRMKTDTFNRVEGLEDIYAIGDISIQYTDPVYAKGHPQLAQVAIQQGRNVARNLKAIAHGKKMKPFSYFDRGDMAIVGRHNAVVDLFKHKVHLRGFLALLAWLFIHLVSLVTVNNRMKTFYNWAVAYVTKDQSLRMIFRP